MAITKITKNEKELPAISVLINKNKKNKETSITVLPEQKKEIFRIENDGRVFWIKNGKMTQAKIDKDLAMAFSYVVAKLAGLSVEKLIDNIINNHKDNYAK